MKETRKGPSLKLVKVTQADPFAAHVGSRLRLRRETLQMSQQELAEAMNSTVAQLSEIEMGHHRPSAVDLQRLSDFLEVPLAWFYEGMRGRGQVK